MLKYITIVVNDSKKKINPLHIFKIASSFNLIKSRSTNDLWSFLEWSLSKLGLDVAKDKYILQVLSKWGSPSQDSQVKKQRSKISRKVVGLLFRYFGEFQDTREVNNLEFLRNTSSCFKLLHLFGKETCSLKQKVEMPGGMMEEENKDKLYELLLRISVMVQMLRMRGGIVAFDVKTKTFKTISKDISLQSWADLNVQNNKKNWIPGQSSLIKKEPSSDHSISSGLSTSEGKAFNLGESALSSEIQHLKILGGKLILTLIELKPRIFRKKSNWSYILPPTAVARAEKQLLKEGGLFPINIIPESAWNNITETNEESSGVEGLDTIKKSLLKYKNKFIKKNENDTLKEGGDEKAPSYLRIKSLMVNFKLDYIGLLRSKNFEITLLNSFMVERDPQIKDSLLKIIGAAVRSQPVDIWLLNEPKRKKKTALKSFREEVSASVKNAVLIMMLEVSLCPVDQIDTYLTHLSTFFEVDECVSMQENVVEFVIDYILLGFLIFQSSKKEEINHGLNQVLRLLHKLIKSESWNKHKLSKTLEFIIVIQNRPTGERISDKQNERAISDILTEVMRIHLPLTEPFLPRIMDHFVKMEGGVQWLFWLFKDIQTEYSTYLYDQDSSHEINLILDDPLLLKKPSSINTYHNNPRMATRNEYFALLQNKVKIAEHLKKLFTLIFETIVVQNQGTLNKGYQKEEFSKACAHFILSIPRENIMADYIEHIEDFDSKVNSLVQYLSRSPGYCMEVVSYLLQGSPVSSNTDTTQMLWEYLINLLEDSKYFNDALFQISQIFFIFEFDNNFTDISACCIIKLIKVCRLGIDNKNKRYALNSFRSLMMILGRCPSDILEKSFDILPSTDIVIENGQINQVQAQECIDKLSWIEVKFRQFLLGKSPKNAWNASVAIKQLITRKSKLTANSNKDLFINEVVEMLGLRQKGGVVSLFVENDNLKVKSHIIKTLSEKVLLNSLDVPQTISILNLIHQLLYGEFESRIQSDYKNSKNLESAKSDALIVLMRVVPSLSTLPIEDKLRRKALGKVLQMSVFLFKFLRRLMDEQGVELASVDEESAKMIYKDRILFNEKEDSTLQELLEILSLLRTVVDEDDDLCCSLNKHDKMVAVSNRKSIEDDDNDLSIQMVEMDNIFIHEFVVQD